MIALSDLEKDALAEIFNVGVGVATASLQAMTGHHVPVSVPVVEMNSLQQARAEFGAREQRPLCTIRQIFSGAFSTEAVLMFPEEHLHYLVRMMVGDELPDEDLAEVTQDAMGELGNIVLHAVISNLATALQMRLEGTLATVTSERANDVFLRSAGQEDGDDAQVLTLLIDFQLGAQHVGGYLGFLLDAESSRILLQHLDAHIHRT